MSESVDNVNHKEKAAAARARSDARPASDDVLDILHTLMHRVRSLRQRGLRGLPHDLTPMDMRVLGFFGRRPGATQSDLAQHSGRDKAQLARLVKGLRDSGLLEARTDAADRRNQHLHLTAQGEALHHALRLQGRTLGSQAVAGLSAAERDQLRSLLLRVDANLRDLTEEPHP